MKPIQKRMGHFFKQRSPIYNEVRRLAAFLGIVGRDFLFLGKKAKKVAFF